MVDKTEHTKKALIEAMQASMGIVSSACKKVGVSRTTYYEYCKQDPEFKKAVEETAEMALDFAETSLMKQIKNENTAATIFYLKTKGKQRGYIERQEIDTDWKQDVYINFEVIPDEDHDSPE